MRGYYEYTRYEGGEWLKLPIPPIPTKKMAKICRAKVNHGVLETTTGKISVTLINVGYWRGTDFNPIIWAHSIRFPNNRIWNSHFRTFIYAVKILRAQTLYDLSTKNSFTPEVKNFSLASPRKEIPMATIKDEDLKLLDLLIKRFRDAVESQDLIKDNHIIIPMQHFAGTDENKEQLFAIVLCPKRIAEKVKENLREMRTLIG